MRLIGRGVCGAVSALAVVAVLAGCGGSSKPGYCKQTENLKKSVQALGSVNVVTGGTNALTSALKDVESNAQAVVSSAKSDFPNETSAINSSLNTLKNSAQSLSGSPSPGLIAQIPGQVSALVTSITDFSNATKSKCS
jgi:hypothetical protein